MDRSFGIGWLLGVMMGAPAVGVVVLLMSTPCPPHRVCPQGLLGPEPAMSAPGGG